MRGITWLLFRDVRTPHLHSHETDAFRAENIYATGIPRPSSTLSQWHKTEVLTPRCRTMLHHADETCQSSFPLQVCEVQHFVRKVSLPVVLGTESGRESPNSFVLFGSAVPFDQKDSTACLAPAASRIRHTLFARVSTVSRSSAKRSHSRCPDVFQTRSIPTVILRPRLRKPAAVPFGRPCRWFRHGWWHDLLEGKNMWVRVSARQVVDCRSRDDNPD